MKGMGGGSVSVMEDVGSDLEFRIEEEWGKWSLPKRDFESLKKGKVILDSELIVERDVDRGMMVTHKQDHMGYSGEDQYSISIGYYEVYIEKDRIIIEEVDEGCQEIIPIDKKFNESKQELVNAGVWQE